ncbi:hypothetical protein Ancab_021075 [Ancistrocladus abbreviatus]
MGWEGEEEEEETEKKVVMVVVEESDASYYAFMWALDNLSKSLMAHQYSLLIFISLPPPLYTATSIAASLGYARLYFPVCAPPDFVNSVQEQEKKVALGLLEKAKSICTSRGINAETIFQVGDPKDAICNAVEKHNINLLVLADQNIGKIRGAFKWSVSDYCVRHAKCPVLVIKKPE